MFQWKAFLWQLAFAGVILVILSAVTLYILSATGVLNNSGRSTPAAAPVVPLVVSFPPTEAPLLTPPPPVDPTSTALLFTLPKNGVRLFGAGESCSVGISTAGKACAEGLTCMAQAGATEGTCRLNETPFPPEKLAPPAESTSGCPDGEVACTADLVAKGNGCIIGRCILQGVVAEPSSAPPAETTSGCPDGEVACTADLVAKGNGCIIGRCIIQGVVAEPSSGSGPGPVMSTPLNGAAPEESAMSLQKGSVSEPQASAPLTGGARVFQPKGEDPTKTQEEIVEALVTLHRHGADCSVGILHKDCTLDLLMQSWGHNTYCCL